MKFSVLATLLGAASALEEINPEDEAQLIQEAEEMEETCKDWANIDESSLLEVDDADNETNAVELDRYHRANKQAYKKHYSKSKHQIDAENRHILTTQAKCLHFVKKYRGHTKVCNWCKRAPAPSIRWKWVANERVWYRWYDGRWHYWGPSKRGFTAAGWTWYKGYWHHGGYVFKFIRGMWYRFQGRKWVRYGRRVPVKPSIPRGPKICRPFFILKKWGFPGSLAARRLPRCRVGQGRKAAIYMWTNSAGCRFLGGRRVYQRIRRCKVGKPHQWKRVVRCVQGPVLSRKGLNYKTGRAHRRHGGFRVGGLLIGQCYKFRAYDHPKDYLGDDKGLLENSPTRKGKLVFQVVRGYAGKKNSITLRSPYKKGYAVRHRGYRARVERGRGKLYRADASFYPRTGLLGGKRAVSFRSVNYPAFYLAHAGLKKGQAEHAIYIRKYSRSFSYRKAATWIPKRVRCPK